MVDVCIRINEFKRDTYITWVSKIDIYGDGERIRTRIVARDVMALDIVLATLNGILKSLELVEMLDYLEIGKIEIYATSLKNIDATNYSKLLGEIQLYSSKYKIDIIDS